MNDAVNQLARDVFISMASREHADEAHVDALAKLAFTFSKAFLDEQQRVTKVTAEALRQKNRSA
jgi:hypothetical protein